MEVTRKQEVFISLQKFPKPFKVNIREFKLLELPNRSIRAVSMDSVQSETVLWGLYFSTIH